MVCVSSLLPELKYIECPFCGASSTSWSKSFCQFKQIFFAGNWNRPLGRKGCFDVLGSAGRGSSDSHDV